MLGRDAERGRREAGVSTDSTREEDELIDEEEDKREGADGGRRTKWGRFGFQVDAHLEFPRSLGIFETLGERK